MKQSSRKCKFFSMSVSKYKLIKSSNTVLNSVLFEGKWSMALSEIQDVDQFDDLSVGLFHLDDMLSGKKMEKEKMVLAEEISILKSLFDYASGKDTETKYPDYIYSAFKSYVEQKTHIKDLYYLDGL